MDVAIDSAAAGIRSTRSVSSTTPRTLRIKKAAKQRGHAALFLKNKAMRRRQKTKLARLKKSSKRRDGAHQG
jgi:hypothetical protein